ncbi:MAG: hypothetical protein ACN6NX_11360, partial [Acinetobacter sp.]
MNLRLIFSFFAVFFFQTASHGADLSGNWKIIDDKSGAVLAKLKVVKQANNTYEGRAVDVTNVKGSDSQGFKNFLMLSNLKEDPNKPGYFVDGIVIDPVKNEAHKNINGKLNSKGNVLILRGKTDS